MKLVDFLLYPTLNDLKARMGIPKDVYGTFRIDVEPGRLSVSELELLSSGEGIEVSLDQVVFSEDGTITYKDSRVLLYIRDVHIHGSREREPRFHLVNCVTLGDMRRKGRFERYVVATEMEGVFRLNLISSGSVKTEPRRLSVCQNCLEHLQFDGFSRQHSHEAKRRAVQNFTPAAFFVRYPRSLHAATPSYNSVSAPVDNYVPGWDDISKRIRKDADWRCETCSRRFSGGLARFLHVHHKGARHDNRRDMLKVLCLGCHAEEPNHSHLRNSMDYPAYLQELSRFR